MFKNSGHVPFLGQRPRKEGSATELEERFEWENWKKVEEVTKGLGSALINKEMVPNKQQFREYNLKFVAIYGKNSREWILTDIACAIYGITTIPIYDTLGEEALDFMFNQTELTTCFLTCQHLEGMLKRISGGTIPHLKNLVILDEWNLNQNLIAKAKAVSSI